MSRPLRSKVRVVAARPPDERRDLSREEECGASEEPSPTRAKSHDVGGGLAFVIPAVSRTPGPRGRRT
ncbi:protein of unknown function [Micropruina glycogenica]|uniref:Uncharacterized protein n=1 Tax=Micropruina glycogenica TaxID=75385 RepID=A0A2N9JAK2_9ACTN|nr:protein of unknown function [Micropruina glycogenica]